MFLTFKWKLKTRFHYVLRLPLGNLLGCLSLKYLRKNFLFCMRFSRYILILEHILLWSVNNPGMESAKLLVFLTTPQPEHSENRFSSFKIFFEYPVWSVWLALSKQAWKSSSVSPTAALWIIKWRWRDSNSWPPACKAGALPTELHPHGCGAIFCCFSCFFPFRWALALASANGLEWTRTTDLTLIRRAL